MPGWVKAVLDEWLRAANLNAGRLFRRVNKNRKAWGECLTEKAVWHVVREYARKAGIERLAPHDLGHVSIQMSERYLGCQQRIRAAVNDRIGIEPEGCSSGAPLLVCIRDRSRSQFRPILPTEGNRERTRIGASGG
jgi:hypothetical protein